MAAQEKGEAEKILAVSAIHRRILHVVAVMFESAMSKLNSGVSKSVPLFNLSILESVADSLARLLTLRIGRWLSHHGTCFSASESSLQIWAVLSCQTGFEFLSDRVWVLSSCRPSVPSHLHDPGLSPISSSSCSSTDVLCHPAGKAC